MPFPNSTLVFSALLIIFITIMKELLLLICATISVQQGIGQNNFSIHDLKRRFKQTASIKEKHQIANSIAKHHLLYEEDESIKKTIAYIDSALLLNKINIDKELKTESYALKAWLFALQGDIFSTKENLLKVSDSSEEYLPLKRGVLGIAEFHTGQYKKAIKSFSKAIELSFNKENYMQQAFFYRYIGRCFAHFADFQSANNSYNKSDSAFLKIGVAKGMCINSRFKGRNYLLYGENDPSGIGDRLKTTAIEHYLKGFNCMKDLKDSAQLAWDYTVLADVYIRIDSLSLAHKMQTEALNIARHIGTYRVKGLSYTNFGEIELKKKNYKKAEIFLKKAIAIYDSSQRADRYLLTTLIDLSKTFVESNNLQEATKYSLSAKNLAEKGNYKKQLILTYKILADLYEKKHEYKAAHLYLSKYEKLKADIFSKTQTNNLIAQEVRYHVEKYKQQAVYNKKKQIWQLRIAGSVVLMLVLLLLLYSRKKKAENLRIKAEADRKKAEAQKVEAEAKRKEAEARRKEEEAKLKAEKARREEQQKLSRDLHDVHKGDLQCLKFMLEGKNELGRLSSEVNFVLFLIDQIANIEQSMASDVLKGLKTLSVGVSELVNHPEKRKKNIVYDFDRYSVPEEQWADISPVLQQEALKVVNEAIVNIEKHAEASAVSIEIILHESLSIKITDNGKGFDEKKVRAGNGIRNMRNRIEILGGDFEIESYEGEGTTLHIFLPYKNEKLVYEKKDFAHC